MKQVTNVLGFLGVENYEIILYLSRILDRLGRKILLVDYSDFGDLAACIPVPAGIDVETETSTYFGVDFTRRFLNQEIIENYDDVLINFGFNHIEEMLKYCTRIVYATDQFKNNVDRLAAIPETEFTRQLPKSLLIKDAVICKIDKEYIISRLKKSIQMEEVFIFDQDAVDKRYKLLAQYDTLFVFRKVTAEIKNYLKDMIRKMYPEIEEKRLKAAYKSAERGK